MEKQHYGQLEKFLDKKPIIVQQDPHAERLKLDFTDKEPQLVIMRSDESHIPTNFKNCLVFRNYINNKNPSENERPIPLPITDDFSPNKKNICERKYFASFSGYCGSAERKRLSFLLEQLNEKTNKNIYVRKTEAFGKGLSKSEYSNLMSDTKIAICPWGASYETFRLSEALRAGCIPIQIKRALQWYDPKEECMWIDSWKELPKTMAQINAMSSEELEQMSENSIKFYEKNISPQAVAKYINSEWKKFIESIK